MYQYFHRIEFSYDLFQAAIHECEMKARHTEGSKYMLIDFLLKWHLERQFIKGFSDHQHAVF